MDDDIAAAIVDKVFGRNVNSLSVSTVDEGSDMAAIVCISRNSKTEEQYFLKVHSFDGLSTKEFLFEGKILQYFQNNIGELPIPRVYDYGVIDETAYLITESLPGENGSTVSFNSLGACERFGRELAEIAQLILLETAPKSTQSYGYLRDVTEDGFEYTPALESEQWDEFVSQYGHALLDRVDTSKFNKSDIRKARECFNTSSRHVPSYPEKMVLHDDYRPGNILVDEQTGEITGVVDWCRVIIGCPQYMYQQVTDYLSDPMLISIFQDSWELEIPTVPESCCYRLMYRCSEMSAFDIWYADAADVIRQDARKTISNEINHIHEYVVG